MRSPIRSASANSSSSSRPGTSAHASPPGAPRAPRRLAAQGVASAASGRRSAAPPGARRGEHERADPLGEPEWLEAAHELGAGEIAADDRGQDVAGEPALGVLGDPPAQQLERDDRDRLVQRERSNSEAPPSSLTATSHAWARRRCRSARRGAPAAPARARRVLERRREARHVAATRARSRSSAPSDASPRREPAAEGALHEQARRARRRRARSRRQRRERPHDRLEAALGENDSLEALVGGDRALSTAYCSLTSRVNAFSVIAMNGTS